MMCRALGWEDEAAALPADTPGFSDVLARQRLLGGRYLPEAAGGTLGYEDGTLRPEEPIKRQHVAVILCRVLDLAE